MNVSPTPWEYENKELCPERTAYAVLLDANGKVICDTMNSDVACVMTEPDECHRRWTDEQGRVDLRLASAAPDYHKAVADLLELWPLAGYELEAYMGATFIPAVKAAHNKARGKQ